MFEIRNNSIVPTYNSREAILDMTPFPNSYSHMTYIILYLIQSRNTVGQILQTVLISSCDKYWYR